MTLIDNILSQSPENTTREIVIELIEKHEGNTVNILSELWQIGVKKQIEKKSCEHKWSQIRDICNEYEKEMEKFMNSKKT